MFLNSHHEAKAPPLPLRPSISCVPVSRNSQNMSVVAPHVRQDRSQHFPSGPRPAQISLRPVCALRQPPIYGQVGRLKVVSVLRRPSATKLVPYPKRTQSTLLAIHPMDCSLIPSIRCRSIDPDPNRNNRGGRVGSRTPPPGRALFGSRLASQSSRPDSPTAGQGRRSAFCRFSASQVHPFSCGTPLDHDGASNVCVRSLVTAPVRSARPSARPPAVGQLARRSENTSNTNCTRRTTLPSRNLVAALSSPPPFPPPLFFLPVDKDA